MNINRDYLIINDVKKSNVKLDNGSIFFYITDKNTQNIFVNLVINVSNNDLIQKYANIENAEDYTLTMNIVKPDNTYKVVEGKLHDKEKAIFEFDLEEDCVDKIGTYKCELLTKCSINEQEEITTSNSITYKVKKSVLNDLDDIVEAPEYPLVIQLFDKLSDINQYEEDRRANELARQLAEQQRQTRFNTLDADMVDRVNAMNSKMDDVEARISAKEQAVDKLIVDTKADIDDYKVAKDAEIDEYKTAKDQQINEAIANQNNKISEAITNQDKTISDAIANQNNKIDTAVAEQNNRIGIVEASDNIQNTRLDELEAKDIAHETSITNIEAKNVDQDNRLDSIEAVNVSQDNRLDAIEIKNQQQDDRLLDAEKVNKRQDMDLKCLFAESKNNMIDVTEEGNSVYLQNSTVGYTLIDKIQGNTMVNCNKEPDKELVLNGNINTQGYSNITLTEGVDGGLVDVALEGNTMVNVCDQKDPVAITKSYTVETGNHVALQGEYDGKCRPVVTGNTLVNLASNSNLWEVGCSGDVNTDYTITSTDDQGIVIDKLTDNVDYLYFRKRIDPNLFKSNTTYTIIFNSSKAYRVGIVSGNTAEVVLLLSPCNDGYNTIIVTSTDLSTVTGTAPIYAYLSIDKQYIGTAKVSDFIVLEGDYSDKPIPDYFEGLQSSFEDNLVTQEMVDSGEEVVDNLGKYKVNYVVSGKNKFDGELVDGKALYALDGVSEANNPNRAYTKNYINIDGMSNAKISGCSITGLFFYDKDKNFISNPPSTALNNIPSNAKYIRFTINKTFDYSNIQIEEGTKATPYEPYKEYKKTFYLNSPLLEGDTIEQQGDNVVHVHRSELRAYETDDELTLPTDMTNTLVAKAAPTYEVISQNDTILCDSYVNGHLDVDSVVPIEKVVFIETPRMALKYLYPSTDYIIQFESDNTGSATIVVGGKSIGIKTITRGINKFNITTNETPNNQLKIGGIGFNASNIVVTEATDQDFGYFEGMKSVGECEDLEVVSSNSDGTLSNTQTLTHEPLRAVGDIKDKYVLIDGKWYIERNCGEVVLDGSEDWTDTGSNASTGLSGYQLIASYLPDCKIFNQAYDTCLANNDMTITLIDKNTYCGSNLGLCVQRYEKHPLIRLGLPTSSFSTLAIFKNYLQSNPLTVIYLLQTPTYEPIEYNPFTVYSNITHISNNSTIPCNMTIKNTGYNCLLKPSTTYTVSSNLGLNTVTTPSTLTEDCLRFYDTDTSTVTTMKNVTILEGDYTTGKPIPSHFSGIESAFEQEYDEAVGKYKVKIRVQNEDASKENYIEFYINEPLRGVGDAKDKVYVKNDKVVVERNCDSVVLDGSDDENWYYNDKYKVLVSLLLVKSEYLSDNVLDEIIWSGTSRFGIDFTKSHRKHLNINNISEGKQWLQQNPTTAVYPLAEPIYEEVEYNDVKLFIESFKNSTLFYDSNIPVTSKLWYSFSIPIVEKVSALSAQADNQEAVYASILDEEVNK